MSLKIKFTTEVIGGSNDEEIKRIRVLNSSKLQQLEKAVESNKKKVIDEMKEMNKYRIVVSQHKEIGDIDQSEHTPKTEEEVLIEANKNLNEQVKEYNRKLKQRAEKMHWKGNKKSK